MSRWKVRKFRNDFFSPDHLEWAAWPEGGWAECLGFPTHAEALAYADRKARTREVVLPRVDDTTTIDEDDLEIMIFSIADHICITQPRLSEPSEIDVVAITPEFAEEVALALLAHAERMEE